MILAMLVSAYGALETLRLLFTLHVYKTSNIMLPGYQLLDEILHD